MQGPGLIRRRGGIYASFDGTVLICINLTKFIREPKRTASELRPGDIPTRFCALPLLRSSTQSTINTGYHQTGEKPS